MKTRTRGKYYNWTVEKDNFVKLWWGVIPGKQIAEQLNCRIRQLYYRARILGLSTKQWPLEDDMLLYDCAGMMHLEEIKKKLSTNKSIKSIRMRMDRLGIKIRNSDGWFSATRFGELIGRDHHVIVRLINIERLKGKLYNDKVKGKSAIHYISREDAIDFCRCYPGEINQYKADIVGLIDLFVGLKTKSPTNGRFNGDNHTI